MLLLLCTYGVSAVISFRHCKYYNTMLKSFKFDDFKKLFQWAFIFRANKNELNIPSRIKIG